MSVFFAITNMPAPYISYVKRKSDWPLDEATFPGNLRFVPDLHLEFDRPVTFFVGENGSGKSTLLEAIAVMAGFPISGGGTNEVDSSHGINEDSLLANALRMATNKQPKDGYFFRAELQAHFASLLDHRRVDPDFLGDLAASRCTRCRTAKRFFLSCETDYQKACFCWMNPNRPYRLNVSCP